MVKGWMILDTRDKFYELLSVRMINRELWELLKDDCKENGSSTGREINLWLCNRYNVKRRISMREDDTE